MMDHTHNFNENDWPFEESIDHVTYSTKNIVHKGFPILTIAHDHDGDWQFLCGYAQESAEMAIVCFGCMYERQPFIKEFVSLPKGWLAWRDSENEPWQREPIEPENA